MAGLLGHISQDDMDDYYSATLPFTSLLLCCAKSYACIFIKDPTIENRFLCPNCNNYGFSSVYTLMEFDRKIDLCTACANRLRADGRHIVTKDVIRRK